MKPSDAAKLQLQSAKAREASQPARKYQREQLAKPRPLKAVTCPGCGAGCHEDEKRVRTCPDCGQFVSNGAGGWAQRGHSAGVACREVLDLEAAHLAELAPVLIVLDPRRGKIRIDTKDERVARSLRGQRCTVAEWLEARGQYLRAIEVDGEVMEPVNRGGSWP